MAAVGASSGAAPEVTVLMPVFNGERFIGEAIQSILGQTFADFELLVINDGSTDGSLSVVEEYAAHDRRIRVVSRENRGLVATLNEGIDLARGAYLARMDCDDISFPMRLQRQRDFMHAHPECVLCGSSSLIINPDGRVIKKWNVPIPDWTSFYIFSCFSTPFVHSSAFLNLDLLRGGDFYYDRQYSCAEDFDLWRRLSAHHPCAVLDDFLVAWRDHRHGVCRSRRDEQMEQIARIVEKNIDSEWLDVSPGVYFDLVRQGHEVTAGTLDKAVRMSNELIAVLERLPEKNRRAARLAFYIFLNRMVVQLAYAHGLDKARFFHGRLSHKGRLGLRSWCLMIFPRWFPDSLVFRLEAAAVFFYHRVLALRARAGSRLVSDESPDSAGDGRRVAQGASGFEAQQFHEQARQRAQQRQRRIMQRP